MRRPRVLSLNQVFVQLGYLGHLELLAATVV